MSDQSPSKVLGGLPQTRPHRRSEKRAAPAASATGSATTTPTRPPRKPHKPAAPKPAAPKPAAPKPAAPKRAATKRAATKPPALEPRPETPPARLPHQPPQPLGTPSPASSARAPRPAARPDLLGTAVQVGAELAEIGISAGARALRRVVARLPRP